MVFKGNFQYTDTSQNKGITPIKPGFHLKQSMRVHKGKCYSITNAL